MCLPECGNPTLGRCCKDWWFGGLYGLAAGGGWYAGGCGLIPEFAGTTNGPS